MPEEIIQAPWLTIEKNGNPDNLLVQNNLTRKRWMLKKSVHGFPLGKNINGSILKFLKAEKLVTQSQDIKPCLKEDARYLKYGYRNQSQMATLIPTHSCNFGCPYCYNKNIRNPNDETRLSPEILALQMQEYFKKSPCRNWILHVIGGGEPLMVWEYISEIAQELKNSAKDENKIFELDIVTNGYFLEGKTLKRLLEVGLRKVRVTLDPEHDKTRPLLIGGGSFETIYSNLVALPEEVELQVGSNAPVGKEKEFAGLLKRLEPLRERITDFNVSLIMPPLKEISKDVKSKFSRMYDEKGTQALLHFTKMIDDAGFKRKITTPHIECEAGRVCEKLVINMHGETTCCTGLDGMSEYQTEFFDGVVHGAVDDSASNDNSWEEHCMTNGLPCPYIPLCYTGCRLISMSKQMGWGTVNCEKIYLDKLTRYELKRWATQKS